MNRNTCTGYATLIGYSLDLLPEEILNRVIYAHFLTGVDPIYVGLHHYVDTKDNRSYRTTAHVAYPFHQCLSKDLRHTTIVLPRLVSPCGLIHELGHVLDENLGFSHLSKPVTEYAKVDRYEAFAEAFTSWLFGGYGKAPDEKTQYLLDSL